MKSNETFFEKYRNKICNLAVALIIISFPILYIGLIYEITFLQIMGLIFVALVMTFALIEPKKKNGTS